MILKKCGLAPPQGNIHVYYHEKIIQIFSEIAWPKPNFQGSHASGKSQGKMEFDKSQGNVREFW